MGLSASQADPPVSGFAITPNDSADLPEITRAIWVGVAGNVRVLFANDTTPVILKGVVGLVPGSFKRVYATGGTTALDMVGLV